MATRMQQRRGTAAQWTAANPILAAGEIGFETDTSKFKMGNGSSTWSALQYFANAAELAAVIDGAPDLLNTLNELAAAMGDDPAFITNHTTATTNVHGIASTSALATTSGVNEAIAISAGASAQDATAKATAAVTAAVTQAAAAADTKVSTAVAALTRSSVGLSNVDNTADTAKPVSTAQATAIATAKSEAIADATSRVTAVINGAPAAFDTLEEIADYISTDQTAASAVTSALALKAPLASPTFTGTVTLPAAGIVFSDGTQAKAGVPSITTFASSFAASAMPFKSILN
jgi:hypothetical protein